MKVRRGPAFPGAVFLFLFLIAPSLSAAKVFPYGRSTPAKGHLIPNVPSEIWIERNYCGPACLSMVLNHWKPSRLFDQKTIGGEIFDAAQQASYNSEMVLYPRRHGFASYSFPGNLEILRAMILKEIPVIILSRRLKNNPRGHYRVVIGFDDDENQIIFHDPYFGARQAMATKDFLDVWNIGESPNLARWSMAVLPESTAFPFPELRDQPLTHINMATGHYRRGNYEESKAEWEKVRAAMSGDPYPLYSLGMVSLRQDRFEEAEAYAREALTLDGKSAYAEDVLGLAYAKQERLVEALQALGRAIRLAPKEKFILDHYLLVRKIYIDNAGRDKDHRDGIA